MTRRPGVAPAKEERESTVAPITGGGWMTISWEEYLTKTLPKRYVKFVGGEDRGLTVKAWCTRVTRVACRRRKACLKTVLHAVFEDGGHERSDSRVFKVTVTQRCLTQKSGNETR